MANRRPTPPVVIMAKLLKHKGLFCAKEQKQIRALELYWETNRVIPQDVMPIVWKWMRFIRKQTSAQRAAA